MVSIFQLLYKCIHLSRVGDAVIKLCPEEYMEFEMASMVIIIEIKQELHIFIVKKQ